MMKIFHSVLITWLCSSAGAAPTVLNWDVNVGSAHNAHVLVGSRVLWNWTDAENHTVNPADHSWGFAAGQVQDAPYSMEHIFTATGTFAYICDVHPTTMGGTITVGECVDDPFGWVATANNATHDCSTVNKLDGWHCDNFDIFNSHIVLVWELCPVTCNHCPGAATCLDDPHGLIGNNPGRNCSTTGTGDRWDCNDFVTDFGEPSFVWELCPASCRRCPGCKDDPETRIAPLNCTGVARGAAGNLECGYENDNADRHNWELCPLSCGYCQEAPSCPADQYTCADGTCVEFAVQCNSCAASEFKCFDKSCVLASKLCDGARDCADGSDEFPGVCPEEDENQCMRENCSTVWGACERHTKCAQAADLIFEQKNCSAIMTADSLFTVAEFQECWVSIYEELEPEYVELADVVHCHSCNCSQVCNPGFGDVPFVTSCPNNEFMCGIKDKCIPKMKVCDGVADCIDGSDEVTTCVPEPTKSSSVQLYVPHLGLATLIMITLW